MNKKLPKLWILVSLSIVVAAVIAVIFVFVFPVEPIRNLRNACSSGDRIVVDINPIPKDMRASDHLPSPATYEIRGHEQVVAFLDAIELRTDENRGNCKCYGELLITIYGGNTELAALSVHHEKYLRWRDGPWKSDQPLTTSSFNALSAFLTAHQCPTPSEAKVAFGLATEAAAKPTR